MSLQDSALKGNPVQMALMDQGTSVQVNSYWVSKQKSPGQADGRLICITAICGDRVTAEYASTGKVRTMRKSSLICNYRRATDAQKANAQVSTDAPTAGPVSTKAAKEGKELRGLRALFDAKRSGARTTVAHRLTPSLASELLENNFANRQVSSVNVDKLARDMTNKRWRASHQGIGVGPNMELGDGQHRALACIRSGVTVPMDFTCYHDAEDFEDARRTWDTNWRRSKANVLELSGLVSKGRGKDTAAILEAITYINGEYSRHLTNEDMVQMYKKIRISVDAVGVMSPREFLAPTRAAFVLAHIKCPNEISECIRLVTTKAGLVDGSAAHALVLKRDDLQRAKSKTDRTGLMKDILSLLYKHVKNQRGVAILKHNERAYAFFLGEDFRPTKY